MDLALDARTTAFVTIDLMERIVANDLAPHTGADVVANCVALADATRAAGSTVVAVRVERPTPEQPPGSGFVPEAAPRAGDVEIVKHTWGAFHETGLDAALRERGVTTILLGGIATNFGVESTARIADEHGYQVVLVEDAMSGLDGAAHAFAVTQIFPRLGQVVSTAQALAALRESA